MLNILNRANLDIIWSRDTATVKFILGYTKEIVRRAKEGVRLVAFPKINTLTVRYKVVMVMDIQMLENYLFKGRNVR